MEPQRVEVDIKRLLSRIQTTLASSAHGSSTEEDILKRWTYVDHLQSLLVQLKERCTDDEEDYKRIATYEDKLNFLTQLMLSSEGYRPAFITSHSHPDPVQLVKSDTDDAFKRQAITAEHSRVRQELLEEKSGEQKRVTLKSETEMRRRLGLSDIEKKVPSAKVDLAKQLTEDETDRENIATDVLGLIEALKENTLNFQRSLVNDASRIQVVDDLLTKNREDVRKEITRLDTLYRSTAMSCRTNCAMISTVLMIWIGVYIMMKITPRPS